MNAVTTRYHGELPRETARAATRFIGEDDVILISGFGKVGYPKAVLSELPTVDRAFDLTIVSGGNVGEEIDSYLVTEGILRRRFPVQSSPVIRSAVNKGSVAYHDRHLSRVGLEAQTHHYGHPAIAIVEAVAVGEDWLIPSGSIGQTPAFLQCADQVLVEVNEAQPLALQEFHDVYQPELPPNRDPIPLSQPGERIGSPRIEFNPDKLSAVVTTDQPDSPYEFRDATPTDHSIASHLVEFLKAEHNRNPILRNQLVLQFGVGSLGNILMSNLGDSSFADRDLVYFGEVMQDGLLDPLETGAVRAASATSFAMSTDGLTRLFDNIDKFTPRITLRNSNITNHPGLIEQFGVIGINAALEVDIYGHVNATHIGGSEIVMGIGGGGDFTRNSLLSIVVLGSITTRDEISRIVPMVPHVDYTEHDIDVIITEHGTADLRGCSPRERAREIIDNCADPQFKPALRNYVTQASEQGGHMPHDLQSCFDWNQSE